MNKIIIIVALIVIVAIIVGVVLMTTSKTTMKDACAYYSDNSTNVSQECYNNIWKDSGCITPPATIDDWHKSQTKAGLISDSKAWATMSDDNHRKGCYGDNKSSWPASYIRHSSRNNFMSY
jgi:hypothetical protein